MTDLEALHAQVDGLGHTNWHVKALVHALIELGQITVLECQYEDCVLDDRAFRPRLGSRGHEAYSLTIDHIHAWRDGGSNRPENLRPLHATCNVSRGKRTDSAETRAKKVKARAEFLADPVRSAAWRESMKRRKPGWNAKRDGDRRGGRALSLTPEDILQAQQWRNEGIPRAEQARRLNVSPSTLASALAGRGAYAPKE